MNTIRLTGVYDNSGYGTANKHTLHVLVNAGFDVTTEIINTPMSRQEFAKDVDFREAVKRASKKHANINIVQLIPNLWHYGFQNNSRNIGYIFWESDRICDEWINIINNGMCSEVWVPCKSNYDALINSGVTKPVYIVPQYTKIELMDAAGARTILPIPNKDAFRFYSIFQWTQRKNPHSLFNAYFNEFSSADNVMLVVKAYGPSPFADRRWIKETIINIKEKSGSDAPVYLFGELMTPEQINAIHSQCNCYVYSGRSEGWNIPLLESMAYKRQIITTKTGGIADWITEKSAYIIPHKLIPIDSSEQAWGRFYQSEPPQHWGDVKIEDVQSIMRKAYNERSDCYQRLTHYDDILNVSSEENVAKVIKERLSKD